MKILTIIWYCCSYRLLCPRENDAFHHICIGETYLPNSPERQRPETLYSLFRWPISEAFQRNWRLKALMQCIPACLKRNLFITIILLWSITPLIPSDILTPLNSQAGSQAGSPKANSWIFQDRLVLRSTIANNIFSIQNRRVELRMSVSQ